MLKRALLPWLLALCLAAPAIAEDIGDKTTGWSTTAGSNNAAAPDGWPENMAPSAVNNAARENMRAIRKWFNDAQWVEYGDGDGAYTPTYVGATQFKIEGVDVSSVIHVGRRVKLVAATPGTIYGTITAVSFSTDTTVTVAWDSGSLSNEAITSIELGIVSQTNTSLPTNPRLADADGDTKIQVEESSDEDIIRFDTGGTERAIISGGILFLNDSANANMTIGLTVNQGAADNHALAFKSSDVGTSLTTGTVELDVETDDWLTVSKRQGGTGGALLQALMESSNTIGLQVDVYAGAPATTDTTGSNAQIMIRGAQHDGANGLVDMAADSNLFAIAEIESGGTYAVRLLLKADDGELHLGNATPVALDSHDDAKLARSLQIAATKGQGIRPFPFDPPSGAPAYGHDELVRLGLVGPKDARGDFLIRVQPYLYMHDGAIWQNYNTANLALAHAQALATILAELAPGAYAEANARLTRAGLPGFAAPPLPAVKPASATVH